MYMIHDKGSGEVVCQGYRIRTGRVDGVEVGGADASMPKTRSIYLHVDLRCAVGGTHEVFIGEVETDGSHGIVCPAVATDMIRKCFGGRGRTLSFSADVDVAGPRPVHAVGRA